MIEDYVYSRRQYDHCSGPLRAIAEKLGFARQEEPIQVLHVEGVHYRETWRRGKLILTWQLQDDGFDPYAVAALKRLQPLNEADSREGVLECGVHHIYPQAHGRIGEYCELLQERIAAKELEERFDRGEDVLRFFDTGKAHLDVTATEGGKASTETTSP